MSQQVIATVQARMGSTRLPGKVLRPINGMPTVGRICERLAYAKELSGICVATSVMSTDDVVESYVTRVLRRPGVTCVRGSEARVDERLLKAAMYSGAAAIVRITADCPLVDPALVDGLVGLWRQNPKLDYVSNVFPHRTYPDGLDVEVISMECLRRLVKEDGDHEALTTNIWRDPERFQIESIDTDGDLGALRWTVDRPDDLAFVRWVYDNLPDGFGWQEVLGLKWAWASHIKDDHEVEVRFGL